jgi:hypothetical protein
MHGPEYGLGKARSRYRSVGRAALPGADPGRQAAGIAPP